MKFWLGLAGCLALGVLGAMLTIEGSPPPAEPVPAARPPAAQAWTDVSDADRAGVPRQMQARVILARQGAGQGTGQGTGQAAEPVRPTGDQAGQAGDPASPPGDPAHTTPKTPEPVRAVADTQALDEVRRRADGRVRQAEAEADTARRRLEQEEARANALSDAAMTARRDLIAARAEVEELRTRAAQAHAPDGATAQAGTAADEARRAAEEVAEERRQALAEERARSEQLAVALAEARRRVAVLETAAEAAQVAHQAQAQAASRERAMMRAGLRRLAVALRAAQVAQSEAVAREVQTAGARDRAEQGRIAAERVAAETRGRLDRLKAGRDRGDEASLPAPKAAKARQPSLVLQTRPGPAPAAPPSAALVPAGTAETLDEERLLARVAVLLGRGDISGARLFLTLGVRGGSARATALLAETYDPDRLAALQVRGLRGDPEKASALYRQAQGNQGPTDPGPANRDVASRDPAEAPPAGHVHRGQPGWINPVRQAGLPAPFVPSLAAPWGGE
ncbi:hypothetical protein SAMN02799631_05046 [Methylobacterium sp. 174MFSha1.1]|uniref:hypothetical protein n=1 Tax=Methylobacterium sp. 174MFSha1.1 TaxID=1502749 RepID=UPI0008F1BF72|nr:hypothetical protein [Methylobacterium sp. 174MFSha1.1]SFV10256.1 hypothetical protein SAMN02799631_05046 [Methylobacterium sp. 174MFSha1.1]